jgi:plastocyanin
MRLPMVCALAAFVVLPIPEPRSPIPDPRPPASGSIRGRVEVRVDRSVRDARPDPSALGMGKARDPLERRRSVVYLETVPRAAFEPSEERRPRLNQRNEQFEPHVLAVVAGTWVDFPNADTTYHNVFSLSKGNEFNLGRYASGKSKAVRFDRPGIVRVFCDIHSHMSAFVLVFAHRYFAVTDDEGRYRIDGVPPGTYTLVAWNETVHGEPPRRPVTIPDAGGEFTADFTIR